MKQEEKGLTSSWGGITRWQTSVFRLPLVDESDKTELLAATKMASHLKETIFPQYRVGLLHGRMKAEEKEEIMLSLDGATSTYSPAQRL